uniref:Uncharacterized protein n=1 Tax=Romanomermis culicivorax TaxID=13658 RepID=A0A915HS96_ROMCU
MKKRNGEKTLKMEIMLDFGIQFKRKTKSEPMLANNVSVVKSPRLAAIGVATLSGLILKCRENMTTATIIEPRLNKL